MVEGFDYGDSADTAMSDDLERENSRPRAQEDNEQLDTPTVGWRSTGQREYSRRLLRGW